MEYTKEIYKAKEFARNAHGEQQYGGIPYLYHLERVVYHLHSYGNQARIVGYLHDVVEDTKITACDIELLFGSFVSRCVSLVSDEPGINRKERKKKTYKKLSEISSDSDDILALIVKTADRLANFEESVASADKTKFNMYINEHQVFKRSVYRNDLCDDIWFKLIRITGY